MANAPIPVAVLTGFLGAGKTTLLTFLLKDPFLSDAAVIINEFGDVGIDHLLASVTHSITASSPRFSLDGSFEMSEISLGGHTAAEPSPPGSDASSATSDADDPAQAATPIQVADQLLGVGSGILQEPAAVAAEAEAISNHPTGQRVG